MTLLDQSNPLKILVVEDNYGDFLLLKESIYLSQVPATDIQLADTLEAATVWLKQHRPDIIFLDLFLPDSNGLESFTQLKEYLGDAVVIILSGLSDTKAALEAITMGAQDYLAKGEFDETILEKTISYGLERRRNMLSLREAIERYNFVTRATHDLIWDWDLLSNEIYRDEQAVKNVYGVSSNTVIRNMEDFNKRVHPDDRDFLLSSVQAIRASSSNDFFELEYRILNDEGEYKNILDRGYVVRNAAREPVRLIGAAQDITERKQTQMELERLSMIARETVNSVIITNANEEITWVNEAFTRITGFTFEDALGKKPGELLQGPESSPEVKEMMRNCIKEGKPFTTELVNYSKKGKKYWIKVDCQPIFNEQGQLLRFFALQTDITAKKVAEQQLVNSEKRFRALIENSTDGLTIIDAEKRVVDISPAVTRILGYTKETYTGQDRSELIHPDHRDLVNSSFEAVLKNEKDIRTLEYQFKRADGKFIWVESTFHNQLSDPAVRAIVLNFREITDRKLNEEELARQQALFRVLVERSPDMKILMNSERKIIYGTPAVTEILGYTEEEFIGATERSVTHPEDKENLESVVSKVIANPSYVGRTQVRIRHKNGQYLWCDKVITNLLHDPHVKAIVCNFWDITREKEAEDKIRESEAKYRHIFYENPFPMYLYDMETLRILECNNAAPGKYGYSREEFLQLSISDIRPSDKKDEEYVNIGDRSAYGDSNNRLWKHQKKNGEMMAVELFSYPIQYGGRTVRQVQINDVTDKLKLAEALEQSRVQQQRAITEATIKGQENEREQLGAELHDNINQILATSKLYLDYAMSGPEVNREVLKKSKEFIMLATEEIRRLSKMLVPPSLDDFGLMVALDDLCDTITISGQFIIHREWSGFREDLMPKDQKLTIYRIVQEQLNNIMKHAEAKNVTISLFTGYEETQITLQVADDGKGFDPSEKRKGVGLRNILSRAEIFAGTLDIESRPGKGCTLRVVFPSLERAAAYA